MPSKKRSEQASRWRGGAVEAQPGDAAERGAERAEGREPVRAETEAHRLTDPDQPETDDSAYHASAPAEGDGNDKIEDAALEHQESERGSPPRGKL